MNEKKKSAKILFLPHGGGPLPLLEDPAHKELSEFLKEIPKRLGKPSAIIVISAHWEEKKVNIINGKNPDLLYDYYGFPKESYEFKYPAPGFPKIADEISKLLKTHNIKSKKNNSRNFDHGLFVPLLLMYPEADIPCIQISIVNNLDPKSHIELGKSLEKLLDKDILIIGSGMSFHNMREFFRTDESASNKAIEFNNWLIETCTDEKISIEEKEQRLIEWEKAPNARFCHPREEHLIPLHVCFGIAERLNPNAELVFNKNVSGKPVVGFLWE